jgi:hypothetical protein
VRELAEDRCKDLIPWRERIGDGRFPAAGARAREQKDLAITHLEDLLQIAEETEGQVREVRGALIF